MTNNEFEGDDIRGENSSFAKIFIIFGKVVAIVFTLTLWSTIGLAVWVAAVSREILFFGAQSVVLSFKTSKSPSFRKLENVLAIWPTRFMWILTTPFINKDGESYNHEDMFFDTSVSYFIIECLWSLVFYIVTISVIYAFMY